MRALERARERTHVRLDASQARYAKGLAALRKAERKVGVLSQPMERHVGSETG
jgi:hypothetical protein